MICRLPRASAGSKNHGAQHRRFVVIHGAPLVNVVVNTALSGRQLEHYSKPHVIEKKKSPLAASNASR